MHQHNHKHGTINTRLESKGRLMRYATIASVGMSLFIVSIKFYAWAQTESLAILSSLIDAFMDVMVSAINFVAIRYALMPPDREHRFGHGKAEDIAALAQTAFIISSAFFIVVEAAGRFINPTEIRQEEIGITVMVISTILVVILVAFQKFVIKRTGSTVITADSYHYLTDILANLLVIGSLYVTSRHNLQWVDPLLAAIVAIYIFLSAIKIGMRAFHNLMDHELDDEKREKIKQIIISHPGVKGLHDLRTRESGLRIFIQMRLESDGNMTLNESHAIADSLEKKLEENFPGAEVIIHQDPAKK